MLFEVHQKGKSLVACESSWKPKELELEKYLMATVESEVATLNSSVFGETLLLVNNQVKTRNRKRADILALDQMGNGVIIELKRNEGSLGVETQALQYLSDFSRYTGSNFITHFGEDADGLEDNILGFLGDDVRTEDINKNSRIILVARGFDPTLYSMGEWLSSQGVAFRCVEYTPVEIGERRFLSFSVAFDRSPKNMYPLSIGAIARKPGYYWHNIGLSKKVTDDWWEYLVENNVITTSFDCQPGDQGERIMKKYLAGDKIIAYATGRGAVGWGLITDPNSYRLIKKGSSDDKLNGYHRHRLKISWKGGFAKVSDAIKPSILREEYGIPHPVSTSVKIDPRKAERLIKDFNNNPVEVRFIK